MGRPARAKMPWMRRRPFLLGMRDMLPLFLGAVPFGVVIGVAVAESDVPDLAGWLSSSLVFGGAAQLTAISLLAAGAPALSAVAGALVVNARHVMYGAALVPRFRGQPRWFRWLGPYVLIDQVFALVSVRDEAEDRAFWRSYYLGAGFLAWTMWQVVVAVGVLAGPVLPEGLSLEFAVPILFIGLVVPTLIRRPALVAAITAVAVTTMLHGIPNRGGMLVGGLVGVAVGTYVDLREERR